MAAPVSRLVGAAGGFRAACLATMGPPGPGLGEAARPAAPETEVDDAPEPVLSASWDDHSVQVTLVKGAIDLSRRARLAYQEHCDASGSGSEALRAPTSALQKLLSLSSLWSRTISQVR